MTLFLHNGVVMETYILKTKIFNDCIEQTYYKKRKIEKMKESTEEEKQLASRSRAVSRIKEIVRCNDFDFFFTLTIKDSSRYNIENSINYINSAILKYSKKCKKRNIDFKYVYIFELTKNKGVHLHGYFTGFYDLYINKYKHISSLYFDNIGFQNFKDARKINENYLIKYIMKSPTYLKQLYHASRGLNKATVNLYHDYFDNFLDFPFTKKTKFCKMITYSK